jgi:hypothetical protein
MHQGRFKASTDAINAPAILRAAMPAPPPERIILK